MATLKYNETFTAIAEDLAANGESDAYIAFRLQISMATFYNYKAQFPEFAEALVVGRKVCYSRVRAKLLKLAQGRCTVLTEVYKDGELYKTIERQLPPNLKAIIYFQKHMRVGKITINENTLPQDDSKMLAVRLVPQSGDPTSPAAPESVLPQTDSKMSNQEVKQTERTEQTNPTGKLAVRPVPQSSNPAAPESALPQADSKMSNERLSDELCWPHGQKNENALPQTDSKMSNQEVKLTEQTNPTGKLAVRLVPQSGDQTALSAPAGLIGEKI